MPTLTSMPAANDQSPQPDEAPARVSVPALVPDVEAPGARGSAFNALGQDLEPGDIVWCAFPFHTNPRMPGDYARPCLVLEERVVDHLTHYVVAYGTTRVPEREGFRRWPGEILFGPEDGEHFTELGVSSTGCIKLNQLALLPAVPAYFVPPPFNRTRFGGRLVEGVRIGRLTELMREVVNVAWSELKEYRARQKEFGWEPIGPLGPRMTETAQEVIELRRDRLRRVSRP